MKALYAFSGDPITNGHLDIIRRAFKIFKDLTVAVGTNPEKENLGKYLFPLYKRTSLTKAALKPLDPKGLIKVVSLSGLLSDYVYKNNISVIIRAIRDVNDFSYENQLHLINNSQHAVETIPLFATPSLAHISSSAVKEIQKNNGDVLSYVPLCVKRALEETISRIKLIGITGTIGSGKSFIGKMLVEHLVKKGREAVDLDLDVICHEILTKYTDDIYVKTRFRIAERFGCHKDTKQFFIDKPALAKEVFSNPSALKEINEILHPVITFCMRQILAEMTPRTTKDKTVFINAAILVECDMLHLCNNNVIMVSCPEDIRIQRLKERGYNDEQISQRSSAQLQDNQRRRKILEQIEKDGCGKLIEVVNDGQVIHENHPIWHEVIW